MAKKKSREDLAFPVVISNLGMPTKPQENLNVIKAMIRGAIKGAYRLQTPSEPNPYSSEYGKKQKPLVTDEEVQFVTHLIESLEPANAIEAALATQFAITYIRGLKEAQSHYPCDINSTLKLFEFGHRVLETLTRYRTKGAQLISVNYNHNQAQVNNFNLGKEDNPQAAIEVK